MELLAPAGNREAMVAAVQHGADAVYLGFTTFGARSFAGNFDADGLREAVEYCHERGRRVYVTVNTLAKQAELPAVYELLSLVSDAQADAVIVQDLGVAALARDCFPDLPVHASTQMTLHNAQGAEFARSLGIARVVPARECPLGELAAMARTGVEIEAFVHGALCVSVSGQCLFSSMVGGRSGNRGKCAQPCRLPYRCGEGAQEYSLSMRDLMTLERLPEFAEAGVAALKIEGRMKRPEYVAVATAAYRRALDALEDGIAYLPDEIAREALLQVFHRGGFTQGHLFDACTAELVDASRPNHGGLLMGKVSALQNQLAVLCPQRTLHDGDGLQVRGLSEAEFAYSGPEVPVGGQALLRVPFAVRVGDAVFRLTDAAQMRDAQAGSAAERRRIPVEAELYAYAGKPAVLTLRDGLHEASASSAEPVAAAQQRALDEDSARKQLERMGDTPYMLTALSVRSKGAFMPVSALNALRRDAVAQLRAARLARPARRVLPLPEKIGALVLADMPKLIAQTPQISHAEALLRAGADTIYWSPDDFRLDALQRAFLQSDCKPWLVLPLLAWSEELCALDRWVGEHAAHLSGVVITNPGQCALPWGGLPRAGDTALNVCNRLAAETLREQGIERITLSPELNARELAEVMDSGAWELVVYGRTQLMMLSHCPQRLRHGETACAACVGDNLPPMIDRKGYSFPQRRLRMAHGCQIRLLNSLPTWLGDKHARALSGLAERGSLAWRLCFVEETLERSIEIVRRARALRDGGVPTSDWDAQTPFTSGHFARGVE